MKPPLRIFVTVLMLVLFYLLAWPAASRAEYVTILELREEAQDGWHQSYQAHGRTITVDVPVSVPKAEALPVLRVKREPAVESGLINGYTQSMNVDGSLAVTQTPAGYQPPKSGPAWFKTSFIRKPGKIDWEKRLTEDSPLTAGEALFVFARTFSSLYGRGWENDLILSELWVKSRLYAYDKMTNTFGEPMNASGNYEFTFVQKLHGIPVLGRYSASPSRDNERHPPLTMTSATVSAEDFYAINVQLVRVLDAPYPNVPVLSFKQVKEEYEKLISAGFLREVFDITLGYMLYTDPVEEDVFWAYPVWALNGVMYNSAGEEAAPPPEPGFDTRPTRRLILLAQDGKLQREYDESPFRNCVPAILTFDGLK